MLSEKDSEFLDYLSSATDAGKIPWQPTAADDQFTVSLKGKYNVVVGVGRDSSWLRMSNEMGQVMIFIASVEDPSDRVDRILSGARRIALNVDTAIDEIIQGE